MELDEFVKKHHWYTSFWADVAWALLGALALLFIFGSQYATGEIGLSANMENALLIGPKDSIIINFNHPMVPAEVEKNISINPDAEVQFSWENNYQKIKIKPVHHFNSGANYAIEIKPQSAFSISRLIEREADPANFSFSVSEMPKVVSIAPVSGEPNAKIDSNVVVKFDKSTVGYDINFVVEPFDDFGFESNNEKKTFTILTGGKLAHSKDYAVSVREAVSDQKNDGKKLPEVFRANFKTESEPVIVPDPAPNTVASAVPNEAEKAKIAEGKYIDINLAKQNLSIFENGKSLGTYRVSTGKRGMATPAGTFKVMSKTGRAYSKKYNLYMPFWMQFTGAGHGIHELPEWKSGYKEGANHLGTPVSHGCVRLGVGPAKTVYNWSDVGTPVVIHY
ncbi:MAG: L,D-transpeptidase family protein [Candidatus Moranbacteria bacterium]|nr:L,D-transpeptidase family protein [Candidatus Moranbacteria bacterium]